MLKSLLKLQWVLSGQKNHSNIVQKQQKITNYFNEIKEKTEVQITSFLDKIG